MSPVGNLLGKHEKFRHLDVVREELKRGKNLTQPAASEHGSCPLRAVFQTGNDVPFPIALDQ